MKRIGLLMLVAMMFLSAGCSAHVSPLQGDAKGKIIYETNDEARVFAEVHAAMIKEVPDAPVIEVNESIRGYTVRYTFGLDYMDYLARVFPATGATPGGEKIHGYYVEVTITGTFSTASSNAKKMYENIGLGLSSFARPVSVTNITPGRYIHERDAFRLNSAPSLREGGIIRVEGQTSIADEIRKLDQLKQQGVISQEEYEHGKKKVLGY